MTRAEAERWAAEYARCWRDADVEGVLALFTPDSSYRSSPFREPHLGHEGIAAYWRHATGSQERADVRMGRPFVDGDRVTVEWWTTMLDDGAEITLPGCLLLRFAPDGRCADLREYWNVADGLVEPHPGWGE